MQNLEEEKMDMPRNHVDDLRDLDFGSEEKPKSAGGWKALLTPALISVIVTFVMFQLFFAPNMVTKQDATTNFENITKTIGDIQKKQDQLNSALTSKADSSQVANLSQQIANIQNRLNDLPSNASIQRMTDDITKNVTEVIDNKVSDMNDTIKGMQADIKELQKSPSSSADKVKNDVAVEVGGYDLTVAYSDKEISIRLYFENDSDYDISVTDVSFMVYASSFGSTATTITYENLGSNIPMNWAINAWGKNIWYVTGTSYYGISGFKVDSDDTRQGFVTMTFNTSQMKHDPDPVETMYLTVELQDFNYKVID